jgi:hypothetical protein
MVLVAAFAATAGGGVAISAVFAADAEKGLGRSFD